MFDGRQWTKCSTLNDHDGIEESDLLDLRADSRNRDLRDAASSSSGEADDVRVIHVVRVRKVHEIFAEADERVRSVSLLQPKVRVCILGDIHAPIRQTIEEEMIKLGAAAIDIQPHDHRRQCPTSS